MHVALTCNYKEEVKIENQILLLHGIIDLVE